MTRFVLAGAATLLAPSLAAQTVDSDSARMVVMQDGRPVGTEDFAFRVQTVDGRTVVSFVATTNGSSEKLRVAVTAGPRRVTLRTATGAGNETASEYPGGPRTVVADERVLSLYALLPRNAPGAVTVYGPPPGGRRPGTLEAAGADQLPGTDTPTSRLTLRSGEDVVHVWHGPDGRLIRVEIPGRGLSAERVLVQAR